MTEFKPLKIGILGHIRAGKDTVSELLIHEMDKENTTQELAFADGIHEVINKTMPEVYLKGKPRKELQHIGQSLRQVKPDVWIDMLFNSNWYKNAISYGYNIIVTDVRQPNEAIRLKEEGFTLLKVTASQEVRIQRAMDVGDNFDIDSFNHETELSIDNCPFDYLIDNSSSIDVLEAKVAEILRRLTINNGI